MARRWWPRFWTLGIVDCCGVSPVVAIFPAGSMSCHCVTTRMAKLLDVGAVYRWLCRLYSDVSTGFLLCAAFVLPLRLLVMYIGTRKKIQGI